MIYDLSGLNLGLSSSYVTEKGDASMALGDSSGLSLLVPENYDNTPVYVAPTNSNNVGTTPPVTQETSFLDFLTSTARRSISAAADAYTTRFVDTQKHETPGATQTVRSAQTQIVQGVPNIVIFGVGAYFLYKVLK